MLRISAIYKGPKGDKYRILVYDKNYGGTAVEVATYGEVLTHEGNPDDIFKRINPSKFIFNIVMNATHYPGATRSAVVSFYDDLVNSYEGRFYITVRQHEISGKILFRGKIISDVGEITLNYYNDFKITAICGLTQLKDIELRPAEYSDQVAADAVKLFRFTELFRDILKANDVNKFFYEDTTLNAAGDVLFTCCNNWTTNSSTGDVWYKTLKRNHWFTQVSPTYRKYANAWDVLDELLTGFNARLIFGNGIYRFEQLGALDNPNTARYAYDYEGNPAGTATGKEIININTNDDLVILADPTIKRLVPFKAVSLEGAPDYFNYLNGLDIDYFNNPGPHDFGFQIVTGQRLILDMYFDAGASADITGFQVVQFELSLKIGNLYAKTVAIPEGSGTPLNGDNVNTMSRSSTAGVMVPTIITEWQATASTIKIIVNPNDAQLGQNLSLLYTFAIRGESLPIPADGNIILELVSFKVLNLAGAELPAETAKLNKWKIKKSSRLLIGPDINALTTPPQNLIIYEIGDIRNSVIYPVKFSFHDSATDGAKRLFYEVYPLTASGGWEPTTDWTDPDMGETLPIQNLCLKQILGMRTTPGQIINLALVPEDGQVLTNDNLYILGEAIYMPVKFQHDTSEGVYIMSLWQIFKDFAGIIEIDTGTPETDPIPPQPWTAAPERPGNKTETYFYRETGVTANYVEIPDNLEYFVNSSSSVDQIRLFWSVWVDGVYLDYLDFNDFTFPLQPGEILPGSYTMEPTANKFHFGYELDGQTIIIKFIKTI
jgi:hypothetical protein